MSSGKQSITPEMTLIEILHQHRQTEAVFRRYEGKDQGCLLCHALFDTLEEVAEKYGLNLEKLLKDLKDSAEGVAAET
jgi:hypothetical protein